MSKDGRPSTVGMYIEERLYDLGTTHKVNKKHETSNGIYKYFVCFVLQCLTVELTL